MKLYTNVTVIFVIWSIVIFTIFYFGFSNFAHSGKFSDNFFENLTNWDGGHFVGIAQHGYSQNFQYAFFPLYPILISGVNQFIQNYTISAVLISAVSALLSINILYQLLSVEFNKKIAERAVFWLLFFPTSFYFLTAYSEGLFFLLTVATFLNLQKRNLFLATIFAALASATRISGLAVVFALMAEVWIKYGINRKNWYVLLSPAGFLIYSFYLMQTTADPLYFITAERHWLRSLSLPGAGFWETLQNLAREGANRDSLNSLVDLIFAVLGVGMAFRAFRFLSPSFSVYCLVSVLLPLFTPTLSSMPRFLLTVFPIFILLALVKNKIIFFTYQLISIMLLSIFAALFINGYWVS